jgi:alpha-D-ribose 1-methylphosphonate 5-triphosphate synthase subunit PhnL
MQFSAYDIAAMLAVMGQTVTIGATAAIGVFSDGPREVIRNGVTVITDSPTLLLDTTTAALVTTDSTVITIDGVQYQAFNKSPDGAGFVELDLTRDF